MHSSDPVLSETAKADSVHPAVPQTSGPSGGHRGDAAPNAPRAEGSAGVQAPLTSDQQYWLDRRAQIIAALEAEGLQIWSDKDRVWLHRIHGGQQ